MMPPINFSSDMYTLRPGETSIYGTFPELRKAVQWFISLLSEGEWPARRDAVAMRFYQSLAGENPDPTGEGRYFDGRDTFAWYLFLGEAFTDHPWNYEVFFGCHVIPILGAIGHNLEVLQEIGGFAERAKAIVGPEKGQPNGGLFEILVAAAYARAGWKVSFKPVKRGLAKTYDLDAVKQGRRYAIECKRMEGGEYVEEERARMRELWKIPCLWLTQKEQRSTYLDARFKVELKDVPDNYLVHRTEEFLKSGMSSYLWDDEIADGVIGDLDLTPIQESLKSGYLLHPGPIFNKLLTGSYRRYDTLIEAIRVKHMGNPHFIDELDLAVVARWSSLSPTAIEKKARDIHAKIVEANRQLPTDIPGIIHVGFEALSCDLIEQRRYEKIMNRVQNFDPEGSRLEFIYCHYFAPETSPEETWAIDETVQWMGVRNYERPLSTPMLLMPEKEGPSRSGVHWDTGTTSRY